jgi:hypothetical protein
MMLFSDRSLLTMVHGMVLSGGALMALAAMLFALPALAAPNGTSAPRRPATALAWLSVCMTALLWLSVLLGTYTVFPLYRVPPPEGVVSLSAYPRALLTASDETRWLHGFAMEIKEHMPWIAAMLATAVAFLAVRYRATLLADVPLRRVAWSLTAIAFAIVTFVAVLGVFVNKVAPLQ